MANMTEAELDRIASGIRPSWELDDAPFRHSGFASAELDALLSSGAANGVHTNGAAATIVGSPIVSLNAMPAPAALVEAPIAAAPLPVPVQATDAPLPVPVAAAPAPAPEAVVARSNPPPAPAAQKPASIPPPAPLPASVRPPAPATTSQRPAAHADPFAANDDVAPVKKARPAPTSSAELQAMKKSNGGLYFGLGAVVVLAIGGVLWISSGKSDTTPTDTTKVDTTAATATTTAAPTVTTPPSTPNAQQAAASAAKDDSIPPPPDTADVPPTPPVPTATAKATAAVVAQQTAPTHTSKAVDTPKPRSSTNPPHTNPPANAGGGAKPKGGIVRDVPF